MIDEDRQEDVKAFYEKRYLEKNNLFDKFMLNLVSKDEKQILEMSISYPDFLLAKLQNIKYYATHSKNMELDIKDCSNYENAEGYMEFLQTNYYKDNKYFLNSNSSKSFLSEMEIAIVKGWSIQRTNLINIVIKDGNKGGKTKDKIFEDLFVQYGPAFLLTDTKIGFGCNKASVEKLFNKIYK